MVARFSRFIFAALIAAVMIGGPIGYALYKKPQVRAFRVVHDGVLYRSGQMTLSGLKQVLRDYGIKTIVTLRTAREAGEPDPAPEEEEYCRKEEYNYYRLSVKGWDKVNGKAPVDASIRQFIDIMSNSNNYPVLVHCFAGKHRTGSYCAIYRMEFEHWTNEQAIAEMKDNGYDVTEEHKDVDAYLRDYRPTHPAVRAK